MGIETSTSGIFYCDARKLITPSRFDLMAKYTLVEHMDKGYDLSWALELYTRHIEAFSGGTYIEPGSETKKTLQAYIDEFESLIKAIKADGMDSSVSTIPVSENYIIGDGAHRTAVAAYMGIEVPCHPSNSEPLYDYHFFRDEMHLADVYMDYIALKFIEAPWQDCIQTAIIPCGEYKKLAKNEKFNFLSDRRVIYSREILFTQVGLSNLKLELRDVNPQDCAEGISRFESLRPGMFQVVILAMEKESFDELVHLMETRFRDDIVWTEDLLLTRRIARCLLNENSRYLLNNVSISEREYKCLQSLVVDKGNCSDVIDPRRYAWRMGIKTESIKTNYTAHFRREYFIQKRRDVVRAFKRHARNIKSHIRLYLDVHGLGVITKVYHLVKGKGFI